MENTINSEKCTKIEHIWYNKKKTWEFLDSLFLFNIGMMKPKKHLHHYSFKYSAMDRATV